MKRSRKQAAREALTANQVRLRDVQKQMQADRTAWLLVGGTSAWQAEQDRRRRARNERVREYVRQVVAAKRAAAEVEPQQGLWAA